MRRCQWPAGMEIRPDGVHRLDPCRYDVIEEHKGVNVRVLRCRRCGHQEIEWEDTGRWIPVRYHEITDSERAKNVYPEEWTTVFDCKMPEDGQEILITTKNGYVFQETAYCEDGCSLDHFEDWLDVLAWMPLPEPYREEAIP